MGARAGMINLDGESTFKVMNGETFVVPDTIEVQSPTGRSSGVYPTDTFNSKRQSVGGMLYGAFSDAAGPTSDNFQARIGRGQTIILSAVGATVAGKVDVKIDGEIVYRITATAVAGVLGFWS